jgi:uncharacterized membrane protein (DUF4010 family)
VPLPALPAIDTTLLTGLGAACGAGLMIGLERERRKGAGAHRRAAGIRSFTLVAMAGALAQALQQPLLVTVGALAVTALAVLGYWWSLQPSPVGRADPADPTTPASTDPGMTTELALLVTYLVGVVAMADPALGAGAAVVVTALLAARGSLHRLATRLLSAQELHDGLLLAALALVLMPLVPQQPVAWLAGLQPRALAGLVLLILLLQAAGHAALRVAGPRAGLALAGLMSGFVSSTATIATLGARSRSEPALADSCAAGAMLSTAATWVQAGVMLLVLAPTVAWAVAPALLAGALAAGGLGWWQMRRAATTSPPAAAAHSARRPLAAGGALRLPEALLVAALLTVVTMVVDAASRYFGAAGALAGAALSGLADAHAGVAALGALAAQQRVAPATAALGVLLTIGSNSLVRTVTAALAGARQFALPVAICLGGSCAAAGLGLWLRNLAAS